MPTIEEQHLLLNNLKDNIYYCNITENSYYVRHYIYAEVVIPISTLYVESNAGTKDINFYFLDHDISSSEVTNDTLVESNACLTLRTDITTTFEIKYTTKLGENTVSATNISTDIEDLTKYKDYIVLSIGILPKLNKAQIDDMNFVDSDTLSSLLVMINGKQICFRHNTYDVEVAVLPIDKLYNEESTLILAVNEITTDSTAVSEQDYVIFSTDIDKMMYPEVALMFYGNNQLQNTIYKCIEINDPKKDIINPLPIMIYPRQGAAAINPKDMVNVNFPYIVFGFNQDLYESTTYPYCIFYAEMTITDMSMVDSLEDLGTGNFEVIIGKIKNPSSNIFDSDYRYIYSSLSDEEGIFDDTERSAHGSVSNYWNIDIVKKVNLQFREKSTSINQYLVFTVYILVTADNTFELHYGYAFVNKDSTDQVELTEDNSTSIELQPSPTFYYFSPFLYSINTFGYPGKTQYTINMGEAPYRTKSKGIYINNFQYRSSNNTHWKSLWKYNRTIEYSSPLQDNPVILPLNIFTDDENENMFIEFIINPVGSTGSITDYCIGLFDTLSFETDINDLITDAGTDYTNITFKNGVSVSYMTATFIKPSTWSNGTQSIIGQHATSVNGVKAICFYYNSSTKKLILEKKEERSETFGPFKIELVGVDKSNLRNIYTHITRINSDIITATAKLNINFGPTSDYFQDYIDEILDQDNGGGVQQPQIIDEVTVDDQTLISYKNSSDYDDDYLTEPAFAVYKQINNIYDDDHYKWEGEVE